jgi:hypothetical protein
MNRCINQLYALTAADEQVIQDTLATRMPYAAAQTHAAAPATRREREIFRSRVETLLQPFFTPDAESVSVKELAADLGGWVAFEVQQSAMAAPTGNDDTVFRLATALAEDEGASRLFFACGPGCLRVVIRNQYRYLTPSQARLCALDVLREHGAVFPLPVATA